MIIVVHCIAASVLKCWIAYHPIGLDWARFISVQFKSVDVLFCFVLKKFCIEWHRYSPSRYCLLYQIIYKSDSFTRTFCLIFRSQYLHIYSHTHAHTHLGSYSHTCWIVHAYALAYIANSIVFIPQKSMHSLVWLPWIVQIEYELTNVMLAA